MKQPMNLHQQQGATLIIVLLVLLLIMVAGAMAVRQSRTDLQVATSDQINTVLLQTADNANQKLEQIINADPDPKGNYPETYMNLLEHPLGLIGYFYNRPDRAGDEVVYCQTGNERDYKVSSATVRRGGGTLYNKGYCVNGSDLVYTSNRNTMVGQVSILPTSVTAANQPPLSGYAKGQDISGRDSKNMQFDIYSTTAIPAYAGTKGASGCFKDKSSKPNATGGSVSDCLAEKNIPQTSVYQQVDISRITTAAVCQDFGTGAGADSGKQVCQVK